MVIFIRENHDEHLEVKNYKFETVYNLKYLDVSINSTNNNHDDIKIRTIAANKCYYRLSSVFKSKQISFKLKVILYKVVR